MLWRENDNQLQSLFKSSAQAKEIAVHSKNLSLLSIAALDAIDRLKSGNPLDSNSNKENLVLLQNAKITDAEVELAILPELEALITGKLAGLPKQVPFF